MNRNNNRELIERVKENVDIVAFIGKYLKLNRSNKAICPFHEERTPSFSVNSKRQFFFCFGCSVGGDVIKFVQLYKKISFAEALREVAHEAGIHLDYANYRGRR